MCQNLEDFEEQFIASIVSLFSYQKKLFRNDIGTHTTAPKVFKEFIPVCYSRFAWIEDALVAYVDSPTLSPEKLDLVKQKVEEVRICKQHAFSLCQEYNLTIPAPFEPLDEPPALFQEQSV